MPELPEVQTIVNDLQILLGDRFADFSSDFEKAIKSENFKKNIVGHKIKSIHRLGKNIVLELSNKLFIVVHLKMTGKLILSGLKAESYKLAAVPKHLHHIFFLKKNGALEFHDIRKFATLEIVSEEKIAAIKNAKGLDPFSADFSLPNFIKIIETKKSKTIKSFLMDQSAVSGIGNIYASEIPFDAKLSPLRKMSELNNTEVKSLCKSILKILKLAIRLRGTSFSDYRDAKGKKGGFQERLRVYGKAGKKCRVCGTIIAKSIVQQRSTFYCSTCQK